jgi:hypothetical protein
MKPYKIILLINFILSYVCSLIQVTVQVNTELYILKLFERTSYIRSYRDLPSQTNGSLGTNRS